MNTKTVNIYYFILTNTILSFFVFHALQLEPYVFLGGGYYMSDQERRLTDYRSIMDLVPSGVDPPILTSIAVSFAKQRLTRISITIAIEICLFFVTGLLVVYKGSDKAKVLNMCIGVIVSVLVLSLELFYSTAIWLLEN